MIPENTLPTCTDGLDNDLDGLIDEADSDCDAALNGTIVCCDNFCMRITTTDATEGQNNGQMLVTLISYQGSPRYQLSYTGTYLFDLYTTPEFGFLGENIVPGKYQITIQDVNNPDCTKTVEIVIATASTNTCDNLRLQINTPDTPCEERQFSVAIEGGIAPYQYDWTQEGLHVESTFIATDQYIGEQVLTIIDANGCSISQAYEVPTNNCIIDNDQDGYSADTDPDDSDPCVPDNTRTDCETDTNEVGTDPPVFIQYPWLLDILNVENCRTEQITRYVSNGFDFLLVKSAESSTLYLDGTYYCNHTPTYDCIAAYHLSPEQAEVLWRCPSTNIEGGSRMITPLTTTPMVEDIDLLVYPNPNSGKFFVEVKFNSTDKQFIRVINVMGNIIQEVPITPHTKQSKVTFDLKNQTAGVYFVQIGTKGQQVTKRIVIE